MQINNEFTILKRKNIYFDTQVKIATKKLVGYREDVIKQDVYATLQQKIELDQQGIDM